MHNLRQVEARCEIRKPLPAPTEGALPLAPGLEPKQLSEPSCIEDLNVLVPEGAPKLVTPQQHPNVRTSDESLLLP